LLGQASVTCRRSATHQAVPTTPASFRGRPKSEYLRTMPWDWLL